MTGNPLDNILARLNAAATNAALTDQKVGVEQTERAEADALLGARIATLEHDRDTQGAALATANANVAALTARIDALMVQLATLGITEA